MTTINDWDERKAQMERDYNKVASAMRHMEPNVATKPATPPAVSVAVEQLGKETERANQLVHMLAERLTPVLRPADNRASVAEALNESWGVPLADHLDKIREQASDSAVVLAMLLERLAL